MGGEGSGCRRVPVGSLSVASGGGWKRYLRGVGLLVAGGGGSGGGSRSILRTPRISRQQTVHGPGQRDQDQPREGELVVDPLPIVRATLLFVC